MKIDVSRLINKIVYKMPFEVIQNETLLKRDDFEIILKSPLEVSGEIAYEDGIFSVKGKMSTCIYVQCSRCLDYFNYLLEINFEEIFTKSHENEDLYYFEGEEIDLYDMILDQIILSLPISLVCDENCKGLCPICGTNLNKHSCDCWREDVDPRLAVLKDAFKAD